MIQKEDLLLVPEKLMLWGTPSQAELPDYISTSSSEQNSAKKN
jgi:hypothetical protein